MSRTFVVRCLVIAALVMAPVVFGNVPTCSADKSDKAAVSSSAKPLPRLVDVGADQCIPCKMMAPILTELKKEYAGSLEVEFVDVWKNPGAGDKYRIRVIPTQIFYDASGKELGRHQGFISKEGILAAFRQYNVPLNPPGKK